MPPVAMKKATQTASRFPTTQVVWAASAVSLLGFGLVLLSRRQQKAVRMVGELGIYRYHHFVTQINLADRRQRSLTIGNQGDIRLFGQAIPAEVARIYAERGEQGEIDIYLDLLDPEDGAIQETILLQDGDEINLDEGYSLKYSNPLMRVWTYEGEQYE